MVKLKLLIIYYFLIKYIHTRSTWEHLSNEENSEYEYRQIASNCVLNVSI